MTVFDDVRGFMDAVNQSLADRPVNEYEADVGERTIHIIDYNDSMILYEKLIDEEDKEFWAGRTLGDKADAIIDSIWVRIGFLLAAGIDPQPLWDAVLAANMTKSTGPICPDTGKRLKPPGFKHPDIAAILQAQRNV